MEKNKKKAFTLVELLVAITITACLVALLLPVFQSARAKAHQSVCLSNVRTLGVAVFMYASDYENQLPIGGRKVTTLTSPGSDTQSRWFWDIWAYAKGREVFRCPAEKNKEVTKITAAVPKTNTPAGPYPVGYGINLNIAGWNFSRSIDEIRNTSSTFLLCDAGQIKDVTNSRINRQPEKWVDYEVHPSDWQVATPTDWTNDNTDRYLEPGDHGNNLRRPLGRHSGYTTVLFVDGHAKSERVGELLGVTPQLPLGWEHGDPRNSWDDQ